MIIQLAANGTIDIVEMDIEIHLSTGCAAGNPNVCIEQN